MIFIVYAHTSDSSIKSSMGSADYSYFFVLKRYLPMLKSLGSVIQITDPELELQNIVSAANLIGQPCLFLQFSPPHKIYPGVECPSLSVFAWEYTTIPSDTWGGVCWNDWREGLGLQGAAITHSKMAVDAVKVAMGPNFPVIDIAAPLWDSFESIKTNSSDVVELKYTGCLFDSNEANFDSLEMTIKYCQQYIRPNGPQIIELDGVIYTSVFCPIDGRKNWHDLVSAFCYAFRDNTKATLLLKTIHHDDIEGLKEILPALCKNRAFKCRIVVIAGFLSSNEYYQLIAATNYVVNSSYGEGQCLPLMEFMSAGVPALAPVHSAMSDYVSPKSGFPLDSSAEWTHWPHDPRILLKTMRFRLNWQSLKEAYIDSFELINNNREQYAALQQGAKDSLYKYCSLQESTKKLSVFLSSTITKVHKDSVLQSMNIYKNSLFNIILVVNRLFSIDRWRLILGRKLNQLKQSLRALKAKL
jgi:hypothetical protein